MKHVEYTSSCSSASWSYSMPRYWF